MTLCTTKTSASRLRHAGVFAFSCVAFAVAVSGCESCLKRQPRATVEVLPYPSCPGDRTEADAGSEPVGTVVAEGTLRAGPLSSSPDLVERYRFVRTACHYVATVRQEWSRQVDDVEVVYDLAFRPLRVWKRMSVPGQGGRSPLVDIRRYELRTMPISMTMRSGRTLANYVFKRREQPVAVIGPGRGLVTAWIRAQHLRPNQIIRGPVLDFRSLTERIDTVALRREDDRSEPSLGGRRVRVYTIFGRESVFADENDAVIGDLAGLRPSDSVVTPMPPPIPMEDPPNPRNTP